MFFLFIFLSFTLLFAATEKVNCTSLSIPELSALSMDNHPDAQFELGLRYANGLGVAKNLTEAIHLYRKSAESGYALAQYTLGNYYAEGCVVKKDLIEAVKWWRKAANQGITDAQYKLGVCYAKGYGVIPDNRESVKWYEMASMQGHPLSQLLLGNKYYDGKGIIQSDERAYFWYLLSSALGDANTYKNAYCNRQIVVQYLTPEQISYIQNEAQVWYDSH